MVSETSYRKELKERILHIALFEFMQKGIRSVKIDDIAGLLVISKRTLYELFADKEELLFECLKFSCAEENKLLQQSAMRPNVDVMDILVDFFRIRLAALTSINPIFFADLAKYKRVATYLEEVRQEHWINAKLLLERGRTEGYISNDINLDVIGYLIDGGMKNVMDNELYRNYDMKTIFYNSVCVSLRGIATQAGIKKMDKLLTDNPL